MGAGAVDVVIPCYDYRSYLRSCVESVLAQDGVDLRVLIIDDASTDDSARIAADLAAVDRRVELRRHGANAGHIDTYNEGLAWADREYAVLLDADDMLTPGALARACALMDARPEVGFVYGRAVVLRDGRRVPRLRTGAGRWKVWPGRTWLERRCLTGENCIHSPEVVMRSRLLRALGGFRKELPHTGDLEMWMRLAVYSDVGYIAGPHQAYYRDHAGGMHRRQFGTTLKDLEQFKAAFEVLFRDHGGALRERRRLEDLARRALASRMLRAAARSYDRGRVDPREVAALEELAAVTHPGIQELDECRALVWRKRLGSGIYKWLQPFLLVTHARRVRREIGRRRERAGY